MKKKYGLGLFVLVVISLATCKDDEAIKRNWPRINTLPVTDISVQGANFNAEIISRGDFEIIQFGFVWSQYANPIIENSNKVVFQGNLMADTFSAQISTTLGENVRNHVRSFVKTADYLVYGKDVEFTSLGSGAPKIISFSPMKGSWGDTIRIHGRNFSYITGDNVVRLGEIKTTIISESDTLITVMIPMVLNTNSVKVSVSVLGNKAVSEHDFIYLIPEITAISPLIGTFLDTITIYGINFGRSISYNSVFFYETIKAEIIYSDPTHIKVIVPLGLINWENYITLNSVGYKLVSEQPFLLKSPVINSLTPDTVTHFNEVIDIFGDNFNPEIQNNIVQIDGLTSEIVESSSGHLKVRLPAGVIPSYTVSVFKDVFLNVFVGNQSVSALNKLQVFWQSTWTKKKDFPGSARQNAVGFGIIDKGYFGTGSTLKSAVFFNDFWEYDPVSDQWTQIENFPGSPRSGAVSFTIANKGYVGTGSDKIYGTSQDLDRNHFKDFYSLDPDSKSWTKIADFQGVGRYFATSFVINNQGYVGTGHWGMDLPYGDLIVSDDFWKYDPATDSWVEIQKFPVQTQFGIGFNIGNTGFVYSYNDLYQYDSNSWKLLNSVHIESYGEGISFTLGNKGYFGLCTGPFGGTYDLWEFDNNNQTYVNRPLDNNDIRFGASVFVVNNKAYVIGGSSVNGSSLFNDVWEFDPSKPAQ